VRAHAIDSGGHLLKIPNIGANAKRNAACVLDFKIRKIEFRLAASHQSHSRALIGKSYCEPLSDPAARARNQYAFIF
jgi:hypothetical protein